MSYTFSDFEDKLSNHIYYYGQASQAFYDLLIWLRNKQSTRYAEIILPAFTSSEVLKTVLAAGYKPVFYEIEPNCQINPLSVKELITNRTLAVIATHFFGMPCLECEELRSLCDETDCFFIEDCMHTLDSRWNNRVLGTIGDASILSIQNMMQLDSGGVLVINKKIGHFSPSYYRIKSSLKTASNLVKSRLKYSYYSLLQGYDPLDLAWIPETGYIKLTREHSIDVEKISWLVKKYIKTVNISPLIKKRRSNFEYLLNESLRLSLIKPLIFSGNNKNFIDKDDSRLYLKKYITPYSFPVIVPSGMRGTLLDLLRRKGTGCSSGWPEAPFSNRGFNNTRNLAFNLMEIPVHQGISRGQLRRIVHQLEYFETKLSKNREFFSDFATKSTGTLPLTTIRDSKKSQFKQRPKFSLK